LRFLESLSMGLDTAIQLLDNRKSVIDNVGDINIMLSENKAVTDFTAKIMLELYQKSHDSVYLQKLFNLLESGLYGRIRNQLDNEEAIRFSHVPPGVLEEEQKLKETMKNALTGGVQGTGNIDSYLPAVENWERFLERIKME